MKTVFIRVITESDKAEALRHAVGLRSEDSRVRFDVDPSSFVGLPRTSFAYWVADGVKSLFSLIPPYEARRGLGTDDDFRFIRLRWEPKPRVSNGATPPLAKGGAYAAYYGNLDLCLRWDRNGRELRALVSQRWGNEGKRIYNESYYFRPGLTWSPRTTKGLSVRVLPRGCIIASKGPALFVPNDDPNALMALLGLVNSRIFQLLVGLQLAAADAAARSYEVGVLQTTPAPSLEACCMSGLAALARSAWSKTRRIEARREISPEFTLPALLQARRGTLQESAKEWISVAQAAWGQIEAVRVASDRAARELYGLTEREEAALFSTGSNEGALSSADDDEPDEGPEPEIDVTPMVASLLSWCLGVAFGRFDVRLATGARPLPPEPDPFEPLPACSPGMLTSDDDLPAAAPPVGYPLTFPTDGVLVDDPGHRRDLVRAVRSVFEMVFDDANARWHEAAELLGAPDLRVWFARDFFEPHIKRYSKSRRKAPIFWQLSTASGSYSVWIYIHRATGDTLFRVLNDFVGPKLEHEKAKLDELTEEAGSSPSAAQRREIERQESFVSELHALKAEVARVAPLWKPNLDDGVILNFAPLSRLVPQSRNWQGECKKVWDKLVDGDYDWAHIAMHLWPERVVPKCIDDRSLAIAHGLEDVFWHEDDSGTWRKSWVDNATVQKLIYERTSRTVKVALKDLVSAATPTASKGRNANGRGASPRSAAPKPRPAAARPTADKAVGEATLRAVKAAIVNIADGASKADVLAATGLSDADWSKAIAALLDRGDVTRTGQKRATRYHADSQGEDG